MLLTSWNPRSLHPKKASARRPFVQAVITNRAPYPNTTNHTPGGSQESSTLRNSKLCTQYHSVALSVCLVWSCSITGHSDSCGVPVLVTVEETVLNQLLTALANSFKNCIVLVSSEPGFRIETIVSEPILPDGLNEHEKNNLKCCHLEWFLSQNDENRHRLSSHQHFTECQSSTPRAWANELHLSQALSVKQKTKSVFWKQVWQRMNDEW